MKKKYIAPNFELIKIETRDIMTLSPGENTGTDAVDFNYGDF
jgi:hypothetical protein